MPYRVFLGWNLKKNCHKGHYNPRICLISKFVAKIKTLSLEAKMPALSIFA